MSSHTAKWLFSMGSVVMFRHGLTNTKRPLQNFASTAFPANRTNASSAACRDESLWTAMACTGVLNPLPSQLMMEDVKVCRSCDLLEHFHHLDVEHASLAIDKLLSHSCGRDQTGGDSSQPPSPRAHCPPLPTESVTNSHSVAAQTNGHNYQLVGHGKVAGLGAELLVNTPERPAMHGIETQMFTTTSYALQILSKRCSARRVLTS